MDFEALAEALDAEVEKRINRTPDFPHGRSIKWPKVYRGLRRRGMSKEKAARISNAASNKYRGGRRMPLSATAGRKSIPEDILDKRPDLRKHYGPGPHPGTGTPQSVHGINTSAVRPGIDDNPDYARLAAKLHSRAVADEPELSEMMKSVANETNGKLGGFEFRLKTERSLRDKIWRDHKASREMGLNQTVDEIANNIHDINRYTLLWPADENWVLRHDLALDRFQDQGWSVYKYKSGWGPGDLYDGTNIQLEKDGNIIEVQFHTPGSYEKKQLSYVMYQEARVLDETEREELNQKMFSVWNDDRTHVPPGVMALGSMVWKADNLHYTHLPSGTKLRWDGTVVWAMVEGEWRRTSMHPITMDESVDFSSDSTITKHGDHDQKSHGNWARGMGGDDEEEHEEFDETYDDRLGRCYELAGRAVILEHFGKELVHGTIQGYGHPPNPHAWVILNDGNIWEPIMRRTFTPEAWEIFANPVEIERYSADEARLQALIHQHWGPWHEGEEDEFNTQLADLLGKSEPAISDVHTDTIPQPKKRKRRKPRDLLQPRFTKHYGPGPHKGTMTEQSVHGRSGSGSNASLDDRIDIEQINRRSTFLTADNAEETAQWAWNEIGEANSQLDKLYAQGAPDPALEDRVGSYVQRLNTLYYRARNVQADAGVKPGEVKPHAPLKNVREPEPTDLVEEVAMDPETWRSELKENLFRSTAMGIISAEEALEFGSTYDISYTDLLGITKHGGPGPHQNGSPQSVHGSRGGGTRTALESDIREEGGFTVDPITGEHPESGYMVSVKGFEEQVPLADLTVEDIGNYRARHWAKFEDVEGARWGAWVDDDTVYFDVSIMFDDFDSAIKYGKHADQLAIFHLDTFSEIRLDDDGESINAHREKLAGGVAA